MAEGGRAAAGGGWMDRLQAGTRASGAGTRGREESADAAGDADQTDSRAAGGPSANGRGSAGLVTDPADIDTEHLREQAMHMAREDAAAGVPGLESEGTSESERDLVERCRAYFGRWRGRERRRLHEAVSAQEQEIADKMGRADLEMDRFERLTNEIVRLKAKLSLRRQEVSEELGDRDDRERPRGIPTRIYAAAIGFLGVVEFFANAPVFSALLPRDPLTERQIRLVAETSEGWLAGMERVFAHLILRPDAALLAAGVVTFLCVLAHFFGHSLRELVMQRDRPAERHTVTGRSPLENVVPLVLSGLGLLLVLGVLYEARITLGEVGEQQFAQDMTVVEELRRNAGWLRVDGDLLAANEASDRADDMENAANAVREYARSMSRLSFPILLLNMTLVLCAISAAYFHRRDAHRERFNEDPFEQERKGYIEAAEESARQVSSYLSDLTRHIRDLSTLVLTRPLEDYWSVVHQMESVVSLYRAENGRARGLDTRDVPAFRSPVALGVDPEAEAEEAVEPLRSPREYEGERQALKDRFESVRRRFNDEVRSW